MSSSVRGFGSLACFAVVCALASRAWPRAARWTLSKDARRTALSIFLAAATTQIAIAATRSNRATLPRGITASAVAAGAALDAAQTLPVVVPALLALALALPRGNGARAWVLPV